MRAEERVMVILAGGQGSRLKPYTTVLPKPLMPVGDKPILEIIIRQLRHYGFRRLVLAVNHFDGLLRSYFGDGEALGVRIAYSKETRPLGTVGPLKLIAEELPDTFMLMNGDVLTDLDYAGCLAVHAASGRDLTIGVHRRRLAIPDGVIDIGTDGAVSRFREKPTIELWISTGIYALNRSALDLIPEGESAGMDRLVQTMLAAGMKVNTFRHEGAWYDIGSPKNLEEATAAFDRQRQRYLPAADVLAGVA